VPTPRLLQKIQNRAAWVSELVQVLGVIGRFVNNRDTMSELDDAEDVVSVDEYFDDSLERFRAAAKAAAARVKTGI